MLILGLTGSIGMGKTTAANDFRRLGVTVHDADAAVHDLMGPGGAAVAAVARAFPGVENGGAIDREALGGRVFGKPDELARLEAILHPRVGAHKAAFLKIQSRRGARIVVLDVPLLFEIGGEQYCDAVVTVSAPPFVQAARVLARPGMTRERLAQVLARQTPDVEKRQRSDFVVPTGLGRLESLRTIRTILTEVSTWPARHWPPWAAGRNA